MYWVYQIKVKGIVRYVGYTNDLLKRQYQHNYLCYKKNYKKKLYEEIRREREPQIELIPIRKFNNGVDAKRFECLLILNNYFGERTLWQSVPKISDM